MIPAIRAHNPADIPSDGWQTQLRDGFRDPQALLAYLQIDPAGLGLDTTAAFPVRVPRAFAERMRAGDANDPLLRQVLPLAIERERAPGYVADPVGDGASRATRGLLHKYHGRVLVIATGACAIHCRYCFRREFPYATEQLTPAHWASVADYIEASPDITEVILSGGDPLMLSNDRLARLTDALAPIAHIRRLRIHSRIPVTLPDRVDDGLIRWLDSLPWQGVVVVHANHANEFDPGVDRALARLRNAGTTVFNQAVVLAGINDSLASLTDLMERGFAAGAIPYYLHLLDRVAGSRHFEVDEARARALVDGLRRTLPGYLVPRLVREQAGTPYKLPVF